MNSRQRFSVSKNDLFRFRKSEILFELGWIILFAIDFVHMKKKNLFTYDLR